MRHTHRCPANANVSVASSIGRDSVRCADAPNSHLERAHLYYEALVPLCPSAQLIPRRPWLDSSNP